MIKINDNRTIKQNDFKSVNINQAFIRRGPVGVSGLYIKTTTGKAFRLGSIPPNPFDENGYKEYSFLLDENAEVVDIEINVVSTRE